MSKLSSLEYYYLQPTATLADVNAFCNKAIALNASLVSVPALFIKQASAILQSTAVGIAASIGYPYGWTVTESKLSEIIMAMVDGASEIDFYINLTALKNNDWQYLARELSTVLTVVRKQEKKLVIVADFGLLSTEEETRVCDLYGAAGVDGLCVNTHPDVQPNAAQVERVRNQLADAIPIKQICTTDTAVLPQVSKKVIWVKDVQDLT